MFYRSDDRVVDQLRPVIITPEFITTAEGSALIEVGNTRVICTASIEETVPAFMRNSGKGWISSDDPAGYSYAHVPGSVEGPAKRKNARDSAIDWPIAPRRY
jgi:ribonuclease PH